MTRFSEDELPEVQPGRRQDISPEQDEAPRVARSGRLAGKVALITGGMSGNGWACAELFAREGARLAILCHDADSDARETLDGIRAEGAEVLALRGSVGSKAVCTRAVADVLRAFGALDILVNCSVGQHVQHAFVDLTEARIDATFRTGILGQMFMVQASLPHLGEGSSIIFLTSSKACDEQDLPIDCAASAGAVVALVRALAHDFAGRGIRVNGVAPGPVCTSLVPGALPSGKGETSGQWTTLGRAARPNEVAPSVLFLACEGASFFTGHILRPEEGRPTGD